MSYIERMKIQGVRAFSTQHGETIQFETPLTLIAGINGSGKTTIIECLRFASTGSLPPGASLKGAWIHDPGLQGEREVSAQVKLLFHAANGTRLVATRNLGLQLKRNTRSQKTKEASLLIERHGQKTTLSTRVAELDQQVPLYLGVSTSLLDNVIFCHQEDSQWPLAESSILKKKFDDIFEAGKYTRAVKELLDIRKKHRANLGQQEEQAKSAKKDRDRGRKVQKQLNRLHTEIEGLKERATDLQTKMDVAQDQANQAWRKAEDFAKDLGRLEHYRGEANRTEQSISDRKQHLKEVPESDEWLENTLKGFDNTLARCEEDKQSKQERRSEYEKEMNSLQRQLEAKLAEQGQYQQEKLEHDRHMELREASVKELTAKYRIRGFHDLHEEGVVEDFSFKIKKLSKDRTTKLNQVRSETDTEKREANTMVNKLTERQKTLKDNRISASQQVAENNRLVHQRQREADAIGTNEGSKADIETRIEELQKTLTDTRENPKIAEIPTKIKEANLELSTLENEMNNLNSELVQSTKRAGEIAELSRTKQDMKAKERSLNALLQAHGERINGLIGEGWSSGDVDSRYQAVSSQAAREVVLAEKGRDEVIRESEQVEYRQKTLREDTESRKTQAQHHENAIKSAIDADASEYHATLEDAESALESARDEARGKGGLLVYFRKVMEAANSHNACRMCERAFKGPNDVTLIRMKEKLEGLMIKSNPEQAEEELKTITEHHKRIADAGVNYESWKRLRNDELPALEQELAKLSQKHAQLLSHVEAHDRKVEDSQSSQREIGSIASAVASITKINQETKTLDARLQELTEKQSQHGTIKTFEEIQELSTMTSNKTQEVKNTLTRLNTEQDTAKSEIFAMDIELRELKNELGTISRQLDRKMALLDRIQEYKALNQKQREIIDKSDKELEQIGSKIDSAVAQRDDIDERTNLKLRELQEEADKLTQDVIAFDHINEKIRAFLDGGGDARLMTTARELTHLRQDIARLETAHKQLMEEISRVEKQLQDSDSTKRHYSDNLRYRQDMKHLKWLRSEIELLESRNMEHDRDVLDTESKQRTKQYHTFSGQREGVLAEMKTKDVQLADLHLEFTTDLQDAAARYKEAHIKFESTKAAIEDIGKYSTALDQAVTKYHSLKMEEVNGIIDELWRSTYMGTDVDTIYIKSDLEVKANTRSHNYRVVMLKRDVELDMRGRCSAGQKVLASIIIRLALAECFSKDCGVIALDEPTTNLDEKNIESLALSLHRIIESRRHQKNFQLIVITHDEHFLELMNCDDFTDHYWRISRNELDESIIERQSILKVFRK